MTVTETEAKVDLQNLLDLTAFRLTKTLPSELVPEKCTLYHKWGLDGSSGHSSFKQIFQSEGATDASILSTTIAPVRLVAADNCIIWKNPSPNSSRLFFSSFQN